MSWNFIEILNTVPLAASFSLLSATFVLSLSLFIFLQNRHNLLNILFGLFGITLTIWLFGSFMMFLSGDNDEAAIFWDRFIYIGVVFLPVLEYHFCLTYVKRKKDTLLYVGYFLSFVFLILSQTDYFVAGLFKYQWGVHTLAQPAHHAFIVFFSFYVSAVMFIFFKHYKQLTNKKERTGALLFFSAFTLLNVIGGMGFLPAYKIGIFPISLVAPTIFVVIMAYIINKYAVLEIKTFSVYFFITIINIVAFNYIFISESIKETLTRVLFFLVIFPFSLLIIRSFKKEQQQKEQLKDLNEHLQEKVDEQTKEIKQAYEIEKRARIKLEDLNKVKDEFISTAAHQLRTPLSATRWALKMFLEETPLGSVFKKEQKDLIEKTYNTNNNMVGIVGDLLDTSSIENKSFAYNFQEDDISLLLKEVVSSSIFLMKDKKINISYHEPEEDKTFLKFDKSKLSMAFRNIMSNAVDYTPDGGQIAVTLNKEGNLAVIEIQDNGIGIPKEAQAHIFEKFYRGANAKKTETDRSGLGLYISKQIILKHGGTLEVDSEEGEGTKVVIKLPMVYLGL